MEIYNLDNEYLITHRYGWHNIILKLKENTNYNIILVDFMDKYFNKWFELPKNIECESKQYNFINKDAYYNINDSKKEDIFIYYDEYNIYHIIKWYKEYNEFKILQGELIHNYRKKYINNVITNRWVGILHYPEFIKEMNIESYEALPNILESEILQKSLNYCNGIIVLSDYLKRYVIENLNKYNYSIPIKVIYHPTDFNCKEFNLLDFKNNNEKKIIQLGFWMRDMKTIYEIKTDKYIKYWLPGGIYWEKMFKDICKNDYNKYINDKSVIIKMFLSNNEYDLLLSQNICILNVFNSSANNSVLECIARNTPLLVNKHPAIIEYLGIEYPFYYNSLEELNNIINNDLIFIKLLKTYKYLKNMNKEKFKIDYFCKECNNFFNEII